MIALIDCNNFYCSCERLFQPALAGKPLLVLSNNDGCAIARSDEAKALGIKMGTPAFMIEGMLKQFKVQVQSSNYTLYHDMSNRVMQVIKELVPRTEVYSIDEIFADLSGLKYSTLEKLGGQIKETVQRCTGIPVSVGIAPTKALAKMANRFAKKYQKEKGVHFAGMASSINEMLAATAVGDVWGIGGQFDKLLTAANVKTAADFVNLPEEWVRKQMSVMGQRLYRELKGIRCFEWEEETPVRKNICTSRSFGKLITSKKEVQQALAKFTTSCCEKLRKENTCARKLQVFIQTNPHRGQDEQYFQSITQRLEVPTNMTSPLIKLAMKGLEMIFKPGYHYQKAGVTMLDLVPASQIQLGLFQEQISSREAKLMRSLDAINHSFGRDTVRYGVQDYGDAWRLRQQKVSAKFTTNFNQVPKAKAS